MNKQEEPPLLQFIKDFFLFVVALFRYFFYRTRQIVLYSWALYLWLLIRIGELKRVLVRRMFWGRSSFYRSAFQLTVGILTLILGFGGLLGRFDLFNSGGTSVLAFPTEQLGDADYLNESGSIQSIVTNFSLSRDFDTQKYVVQPGDTLSSIAEKFSVSTDTIRWANDISGDFLRVGAELEILPINGVVHEVEDGDSLSKIAEKYEASEQDIYDINWLESKNLKVGQELLVPNGRMPQPKPVIAATPTAPYTPPTNVPYLGSGNFVRPAACGSVTNWYSGWHRGVDIAQSGGCNIIAVDSGTVTYARWHNGGGGFQIEIDHGNGFYSLYAHNSSIFVKEGQQVTKGQAIGYMGCTGRCTGTHLHFGLAVNGVYVNPLSYIGI